LFLIYKQKYYYASLLTNVSKLFEVFIRARAAAWEPQLHVYKH